MDIHLKIFKVVWNEKKKDYVLEDAPSSKGEYTLYTNSEYRLILELKEDKEDKTLQNKIEKFEIKPELPGKEEELSKDKKRIIKEIIPLREGYYSIKIELIIKDKFSYEEPISLDLKLNIIGEKKVSGGVPSSPGRVGGIVGGISPTGIVPGDEKIKNELGQNYMFLIQVFNKKKKEGLTRVVELGKQQTILEMDKDSIISLEPYYTKSRRNPLPGNYDIDWEFNPQNNLKIIKIDETGTWNCQITSTIEQKVKIIYIIKLKDEIDKNGNIIKKGYIIASAEAEIYFKSGLQTEKEYEYLKQIYPEIKNKIDDVFETFREENNKLNEIENLLHELPLHYKEYKQDAPVLEELKKLDKTILFENEIKGKLTVLTSITTYPIPNAFKDYLKDFIIENGEVCDQIISLLKHYQEELNIKKIKELATLEKKEIDEIINEEVEILEICINYRRETKNTFEEVEKKLASPEAFRLANAFKKIFPFFR